MPKPFIPAVVKPPKQSAMKIMLIVAAAAIAATLLLSCFDANKVNARPMDNDTPPVQGSSIYDLTVNTLDGGPVSLSQYKGKKIIILNVASKCGYTPQYADWEKFYSENKDQVVVLGFPCNDFMGQEPGTAEQIAEFCQKNYGVSFPMFEKVSVKGKDKAPIYQWLTDPAKNGWNKDEPSWNFCKYLINENGELTHFFASKVKPSSQEFISALAK
jgi:glutathione peroxidase